MSFFGLAYLCLMLLHVCANFFFLFIEEVCSPTVSQLYGMRCLLLPTPL